MGDFSMPHPSEQASGATGSSGAGAQTSPDAGHISKGEWFSKVDALWQHQAKETHDHMMDSATLASKSTDKSDAERNLEDIPISFAEFKLLRLLGKGAFGTVYQACHLPSGTSMALKILRAKHVRRRHLRAELNVLSQLPVHPCLPRFFCCISSQKRIFLATEYIDGPTLGGMISGRGRMSEDALRVLVAQLVCAL